MVFKQLPVGRRPVLASLVRMDQGLIEFNLAVPHGTVQAFQHQRAVDGGARCRTDHAAAGKVDPDSKVAPSVAGADISDATAQERLVFAGRNYTRSQLSNIPTALVLLLRQALNPRRVLA